MSSEQLASTFNTMRWSRATKLHAGYHVEKPRKKDDDHKL